MSVLFKAALLALGSLPLLSNARTNIAPWEHPEIVRVDCAHVRGTAFRVGPQTYLSVAHVTSNRGCQINGRPFEVVRSEGDFSILHTDMTDTRWFKVNCGGFVPGHKYVAIGYALGLDTQTEIEVTATGKKDGQRSILEGVFTVIPGQSGGAMIDEETGQPTGTINTYNADGKFSGSVDLKSTSACRNA
jgi:hypothetical protein